jgi:hypothetical protein
MTGPAFAGQPASLGRVRAPVAVAYPAGGRVLTGSPPPGRPVRGDKL